MAEEDGGVAGVIKESEMVLEWAEQQMEITTQRLISSSCRRMRMRTEEILPATDAHRTHGSHK